MKSFITIALIAGVLLGIWKLWEVYDQKTTDRQVQTATTRARSDGTRVPGMDPALEQRYREAQEKGAPGIKLFLDQFRGTRFLVDPRLAWVEIDYAMLLRLSSPAEAKRVFLSAKERIKPGTPMIWDRIKEFENSFQ